MIKTSHQADFLSSKKPRNIPVWWCIALQMYYTTPINTSINLKPFSNALTPYLWPTLTRPTPRSANIPNCLRIVGTTDRLGKWAESHSLGAWSFQTRIWCHFTPCSSLFQVIISSLISVGRSGADHEKKKALIDQSDWFNPLNPCTFAQGPPHLWYFFSFPPFTLSSPFQLKNLPFPRV